MTTFNLPVNFFDYLKKVLFAVTPPNKTTQFKALRGIQINIVKSKLELVASNGPMVIKSESHLTTKNSSDLTITLFGGDIKELIKKQKKIKKVESITLSIDGCSCKIVVNKDQVFSIPIMQDKPLKLSSLIDFAFKDSNKKILVARQKLLESLKEIDSFSVQKNTFVNIDVNVKDQEISINAQSIPIEFNGYENIELRINKKLILESVKNLHGTELLISVGGSNKPVILQSHCNNDGLMYIVMPTMAI